MALLRKLLLPVNILLFNVSRLIPFRNKKLWILGAFEGKKYDDNSKYMFEYMTENHQNFRCIWLTNSKSTYHALLDKGKEVFYNNSIKGKWYQMRCGVAFYTHGLMDFGLLPLVAGAEIVALWHGMGFKQIYNGKYHGIKLKAKKALDHLFSWTYRTISIATSQYSIQWLKKMFTLNGEKIYITGQPRNDAFKNINREIVLKRLGVNPQSKIIIFMPTYRHKRMGENAMEIIIRKLYESTSLTYILNSLGYIFLVKLHPLTPSFELPYRDNFRLLNYYDIYSNQELLGVCDMLVTDYSSCYVDYALMNRPIIFYVPDMNIFFEQSERLEDDFLKIATLNIAYTPEELAKKISQPSMDAVREINNLFEDSSIKDSIFSENVFNVIVKELGFQRT